MRNLILLCVAALATQSTYATIQGGQDGNGGDICENRIQSIALDISDWINKVGSAGLTLPTGFTLDHYNTAMQDQIEKAKVSCTQDVIMIGGVEKTCENFIDITGESNIRCNFNRFNTTGESDQYALVHHEYAGLSI